MTGRHNVGRVFTRAEIWLFLHISLISCGTINSSVASYPPSLPHSFSIFLLYARREKAIKKWNEVTLIYIFTGCVFFSKFFFGDKNGVCHILMRWYFAYSIFRKCVPIMWLLQIDRLHVYDDRDVFLFFAFFVAKLFERGKKMDQIVFGSFV